MQRYFVFGIFASNSNVKYLIMTAIGSKHLKIYYSIKEVAKMFDVTESLLRYWEKEFPQLNPKTGGGNIRQYSDKDIELIRSIHNLVKVRGFKLASARKMLTHNKDVVDKNAEVMERLMGIKDELKEIKRQLDYLT